MSLPINARPARRDEGLSALDVMQQNEQLDGVAHAMYTSSGFRNLQRQDRRDKPLENPYPTPDPTASIDIGELPDADYEDQGKLKSDVALGMHFAETRETDNPDSEEEERRYVDRKKQEEHDSAQGLTEAGTTNITTPPVTRSRTRRGVVVVEPSDRNTRFNGTKRPFTGENLEGDAIPITTDRRKKKKTSNPFPTTPPTSPEQAQKRQRTTTGSKKTEPIPSNRTNLNHEEEFARRRRLERDHDETNWYKYANPRFSWNQPEGSGPGLEDDSMDPNPIYNVKRIVCRIRNPQTNLIESWNDGKVTIHEEVSPDANPRVDYDQPEGSAPGLKEESVDPDPIYNIKIHEAVPTDANPRFEWSQSEGSGPGIKEESVDPDPIYNVKRIICRFRNPRTNLIESWKNGEVTIHGEAPPARGEI